MYNCLNLWLANLHGLSSILMFLGILFSGFNLLYLYNPEYEHQLVSTGKVDIKATHVI